MVTSRPRLLSSVPLEEAAIPLPREETTPPVTKTNLVMPFPSQPRNDGARAPDPPACRSPGIHTLPRPRVFGCRSIRREAVRAAPRAPAGRDQDASIPAACPAYIHIPRREAGAHHLCHGVSGIARNKVRVPGGPRRL